MARIFITGSADGLGSLAAQALIKEGHQVVLHARNAQRAKDAAAACPGAEKVLVADLSDVEETKKLAEEVNELGQFDAIVHNAGLYSGKISRNKDGIPALVQVNTFAPYILTSLINKPKRLVYVSSGLHSGGNPTLSDLTWKSRKDSDWSSMTAYSDSKLHMCLLSNAVARKWPTVISNTLDPGWVPTKMGGSSASGDLGAAVKTYLMLIKAETDATGKFFYTSKEKKPKSEALDTELQDKLLAICKEVTGITFPEQEQRGSL